MSLFRKTSRIKLQDVDAAGILFFPRFLEYCHDTYFELLDQRGLNLPSSIASGPYILPLVHTDADFMSPLRFGDEIIISVDRAIPKTSSYTVEYTIVKNDEKQTLCCRARTVHAAISRDSFTPLERIPEEVMNALKMEPHRDD